MIFRCIWTTTTDNLHFLLSMLNLQIRGVVLCPGGWNAVESSFGVVSISFTQSCFCEVCLSGFKMLCLCQWDKRWLKWLGLSLSDAPETVDRKQLVYCSMLKGKHENILLSSNVLNKENTQKIHVFPLVLSRCIGHSKVRRLTECWCICGTLRSGPRVRGEWMGVMLRSLSCHRDGEGSGSWLTDSRKWMKSEESRPATRQKEGWGWKDGEGE